MIIHFLQVKQSSLVIGSEHALLIARNGGRVSPRIPATVARQFPVDSVPFTDLPFVGHQVPVSPALFDALEQTGLLRPVDSGMRLSIVRRIFTARFVAKKMCSVNSWIFSRQES